jgi:uncharacterized protein YecT (DUF1311 family)
MLLGRIFVSSTAVLIGAAVFAWAGDQGEPEQTCDGSTYEIVECLKVKTAQWDKRLNAAYQQALEDAQPKQREQLRAAQRLWIQYRDANCLYYDLGEGTIARIEAGYCMKDLTQARAQELESKTERH